jgi:putative PIN family toxin of toxin-antitoxin system
VSTPLRAVPDTNILIAAAIKPTGLCGELLLAAIALRWQPVVSPHLLTELEEVLRRPKFSATIHEATIREFAAGIAAISEIETDPPTTAARSRDQKDDYLLELAMAANVDVLISGDRDLTDLQSPGVLVQTPRSFLESIGET